MRLFEVLREGERGGCLDCEIAGICDDTRALHPGDVFVAIAGRSFDGHTACAEMLGRGAAAVVVERDLGLGQQIVCPDTRAMLATLCSRYFGEPGRELGLVGVTGTNGKSTTVALVTHILRRAGHPCGSIGTVGYDVAGEVREARMTTPHPFELYGLLREMADNGATRCVIEASSQGLSQRRLADERLACGVFTNLTRDHLHWHLTMEDYYQAKRSLFCRCAAAVVNVGDPWGARLADELRRRGGTRVTTVGREGADFAVRDARAGGWGTSFTLADARANEAWRARLPLLGSYNALNAACAVAACACMGVDPRRAVGSLPSFPGVPGRMELLHDGDFRVVCDYAHNEDGLAKALSAARPLASGRLIVVFGAVGEGDAGKRPAMGRVVAELADLAVLTSDNPNHEDPLAIIDQVREGMAGGCAVKVVPDRREAVRHVAREAAAGDVVMLCGKGHERYDLVDGAFLPFSERDFVRELCG